MKKTLLILLLFITSTAQAERRTVKVVDRAPPRKALTDVNGHLMVEHSGIKTDVDGHLIVEHTRAMTNSKRRSLVTDELNNMLMKLPSSSFKSIHRNPKSVRPQMQIQDIKPIGPEAKAPPRDENPQRQRQEVKPVGPEEPEPSFPWPWKRKRIKLLADPYIRI